MSFLLDAHTLLWALLDKKKLSAKVTAILENGENEIFVSSVTFWEISLKFSLGKLDLNGLRPEALPVLTKELAFEYLPLSPPDAADYHVLDAKWHRDPFDRMLIWQAVKNDLTLLSKDKNMALYKSVGLKLVW